MTPQELREEFEATFAGFVAQLDAIDAQDKANREEHSRKGTSYWADLLQDVLDVRDLKEVVNEWPAPSDASLQARAAELAQVAVHALALYEQEHRCLLLGRTYTETGVVAAHRHAGELLETARFGGLLRMIHASPMLLQLFDHKQPDKFKGSMELVVSAFPEPSATALFRPDEDKILTVILPMLGPDGKPLW